MTSTLTRNIFLWTTVVAVVVTVVAGIIAVGSPNEARMHELDAKRVQDLNSLTIAINAYWRNQDHLPASLHELSTGPGFYAPIRDPNGTFYDFHQLGERKYDLCAIFDRESEDETNLFALQFRHHGAGHQCFALSVDRFER